MIDYLKGIFLTDFGCTYLRNSVIILIFLYKLKIISETYFRYILNILFIPLIISLFNRLFLLILFIIQKKDIKDIKDITNKNRNAILSTFKRAGVDIDNVNSGLFLKFSYIFKLILFYYIVNYVKPTFSYDILIPSITLSYIFMLSHPQIENHLGKEVDINNFTLTSYLTISSVILFYIISSNYNHPNYILVMTIVMTILLTTLPLLLKLKFDGIDMEKSIKNNHTIY